MSARRSDWTEVKERPEVTEDGNFRVTWFNTMAGIPLALSRQFRMYRAAANTFKTDGFDCMRFERSSSIIRPKLPVYELPKHWTAKPQLNQKNNKLISLLISFFIVFTLQLLFKCRFVARQRGLPRKFAECVFVPINKRSFERFMCWDRVSGH